MDPELIRQTSISVPAEPLQIEREMAVIEGVSGTSVARNERAVERFAI
jgi:hypothetical protein